MKTSVLALTSLLVSGAICYNFNGGRIRRTILNLDEPYNWIPKHEYNKHSWERYQKYDYDADTFMNELRLRCTIDTSELATSAVIYNRRSL